MALIPGTLPSDTCYGTPQDLLELFAQYLDVPAFALNSKVVFSTTTPSVADVIWIDNNSTTNPILKISNGSFVDYIQNYTKNASVDTIASGDYILFQDVSASDNIKKTLASGILPPSGSVTYSMLSASATESLNVAKRTAKAWVNFNGTGSVAIRGTPFNVSSITDNGGNGDYTVNFTSSLSDANYIILATTDNGSSTTVINTVEITSQSTSSCTITTQYAGGATSRTATDKVIICVGVFGS
jgi:hypothetical protein